MPSKFLKLVQLPEINKNEIKCLLTDNLLQDVK